MTLLTVDELQHWLGRIAQDAYGDRVGVVAEVLTDRETGAAEWLLIAPVDGDGGEGALVPVEGVVQTGQQVRLPVTRAQLEGAVRLRRGEELDLAGKRRAAAHYGLVLDEHESPTGRLRPRARTGPDGLPEQRQAPGAGPERNRREIVTMLRAAHAMEQGALKDLNAMRWRDSDATLVHDITFHHKATNRHAAMVRNRLGELGAVRMRPLDWALKAFAYVHAQVTRLRSHPDPADAKAALTLERHEIELYEALERLAHESGDERTAELARKIRADEEAMAYTLAGNPMVADPGKRSGGPSPFEAPASEKAVEPRT